MLRGFLVSSVVGLVLVSSVYAGDVEVVAAEFVHSGQSWTVHVTLRHGDTGWDHYADAWRIVSESGEDLGTRVLYHPHEQEQPFTRSLTAVTIPKSITIVYIEGHDKVHGWSPNRLRVDLSRDSGEAYKITR